MNYPTISKLALLCIFACLLSACKNNNDNNLAPEETRDFPRNGLVAFYPFNGNANDESPNTNNGTVNGATLTSDRFGKANQAYSFDGIDDFINCGNSTDLQITGNISICAWVKTAASGNATTRPIVAKWDNLAVEGYFLSVNFEEFVRINLGFDNINTSTTLPNNQWKFIAVTYDGNTLSTYIDGVLNNTKTTSGAIANTSSSLNIGREPSGATFFFDGDIDDVMIYNRSLSAGEVVQIFNQNITE